ncbi:hypothetical protein GJ697_11245 [Pseudoduganella sp. FT25W]|jgi:hypothetical protein|uniref:Uncharacterized protein n=1 Tax=Duganella alba TaxID=2666081 RepID=A0A6L5QHF3_9BURK|nr:hypothetical protein [Duganella alba]MRX08411.1 hypothetical protein [Duganella alba]MRX17115.1 hypothetical protein [Duganella alba]
MWSNQSPWDFSIYDKATPRCPPSGATPAQLAALAWENQVRHEKIEHGAFFDAKGVIILAKQGLQSSVGFTLVELQRVNGTLFSHNHPSGHSFSAGDIVLSSECKLVELRAVSPDWRHFMRFKNGWPSRPAILWEQKRAEPQAKADVTHEIRAGRLDPRYGTWEISHRIVAQIAAKFNILYQREPS